MNYEVRKNDIEINNINKIDNINKINNDIELVYPEWGETIKTGKTLMIM